MTRHRLSIGTLRSRVQVGAADARAWAQRIETAMTGAVPRAMGVALERRFGSSEAVIRVEHLRLGLRVPPDLGAEALGQMLAHRVMAVLDRAPYLAQPQMLAEGVLFWPSRAAYVADFVRDKLHLREMPGWAFPDFAPLRYLTRPQAVTEVLVSSGGGAALQALAHTGTLDLPGLAPQEAERVLAALEQQGHAALPEPEMVRAAMQAQTAVPLGPPEQRALRVLLHMLAKASAPIGRDSLAKRVTAARAGVAFRVASDAGGAVPSPDGQDGRIWAALAADALPLPRPFTAALRTLYAQPALRDALHETAANGPRSSPAAPQTKPQDDSAGPPDDTPPAVQFYTPQAGLALILPLMDRHLPPAALHPAQMRAIARDLLAEDTEPDPKTQDTFFPVPPNLPPPLDLPDDLPNDLPGGPALPPQALAGHPCRSGTAGFADLLLAQFAAGLSGLQGASRAYLRAHFLARPGTVHVTPTHILVRLQPLPLGILLQMSGLLGARGPIPHLAARSLTLTQEDTP